MGYTNKWTPNTEKLNSITEFPKEMLKQMYKIEEKYNAKHADAPVRMLPFKNYIALTTKNEEDRCDTFNLDLRINRHTNDRVGIDSWKFCKTHRMDYDAAVKCVLMLLTSYGFLLDWSHGDDGRCREYRRAVALAKECEIPVVRHYHIASGKSW